MSNTPVEPAARPVRILMIGDVVGSGGRDVLAAAVGRLRAQGEVDFVVANAENAAGGKGLTGAVAEELLRAGVDVITLGDHTWDQPGFENYLAQEHPVVRPANFAPGCPGRGRVSVDTAWGRITVINLIGRVFMQPHYDCPFRAADALLQGAAAGPGRMVLVDIHAEATAEKVCLGRYLDGRVSCVAGTHTHVQTADAAILPKGTAYITDLGMTGPKDGVIGRDSESISRRFLTGMPAKFKAARQDTTLEGVLVSVDRNTGRAVAVTALRDIRA